VYLRFDPSVLGFGVEVRTIFRDAQISGSFTLKPSDRATHQEIDRIYY
jgi:hypothetical protein